MQNSSLASAKTSCLIRDPKKAEQIRQAYPDVEIVVGDLDNTKLITEEAEKADVVLRELYGVLVRPLPIKADEPTW